MFRIKKMTKMIACAAAACMLSFAFQGIDVSAEQGATIIINGTENAEAGTDGTDGVASSEDTPTLGNKVIIIGPTAEPAPTVAPSAVAGTDDSQSASINIDEVYVDSENTDEDYYIDDSGSSSVKVDDSSSSSSSGKTKKKTSAKKSTKYSESVPKTGVVRWEFLFAGIGVILLAAGTLLSVRYIRYNRNQAG